MSFTPTISRLNRDLLTGLPAHVAGPQYDPKTIQPGIVHIGTHNFFLAHFCHYIHDILPVDPTWGIIAASIRTNGTIKSLRQNDNLYVVQERGKDHLQAHVLAPIVETVFAPENPRQLVTAIASSNIKLLTMTVSNAGYCFKSGKLDLSEGSDVTYDLNLTGFGTPKTIYWYLLNGLRERFETNGEPITIISLDNIQNNSKLLKQGVQQFFRRTAVSPDFMHWFDNNVEFCVTTVDRITPATTDSFRKDAYNYLGFESALVVGTEHFRQLVVEKSRFPMPPFREDEVHVVDDSSLSWDKKYFALNTGHQVVVIPALRLGITHVFEAMENQLIARLLDLFHQELEAFIPGVSGYVKHGRIVHRFADNSVQPPDTCVRVAARGTSKIAERVLGAVNRTIAVGNEVPLTPPFVTACWLLNLAAEDEYGEVIDLKDDIAPKLVRLQEDIVAWCRVEGSTRALAQIFRRIGEASGFTQIAEVSANKAFIRHLAWSLRQIHKNGVNKAIDNLLAKARKAARARAK